MPQAIRIFLKDAHRSWPYIAVVLAISAMLAALTPRYSPVYSTAEKLSRLVDALQFLLPMAWWFTVAHVVQGDGLAGDKQFWVTRPYSWKSLLAAKVLFCVVFLTAPMLISDCLILSADGFPPLAMISGLLLRQCDLFAFLMLPAMVLAMLTRNMRQFILGGFLLALGFVLLALMNHSSDATAEALANVQPATASWSEKWLGTILYAAGLAALVLWQYARRQTGAVRAIVAALLVWGVVSSAWPTKAIAFAPPQPPAPPVYPEIAVSYAAERSNLVGSKAHEPTTALANDSVGTAGASGMLDTVPVAIPIQLTGWKRDLLDVEMAAVRIEPARGAASTPSVSDFGRWNTHRGEDWIEVRLDRPAYRRLSTGPVTIRAVIFVVVYEVRTTTAFRPGGKWVNVPGFGSVTILDQGVSTLLLWRVPLREPEEKLVFSARDPDSGISYSAAGSGFYPRVAETTHISPVVSYATPINIKPPDRWARLPQNALCEIAVGRPVALIRRDLEIPNIRLKDYAAGDSYR
jgi:hypothetical protein